jgi:CDP-paratose 2-epimerase
MIQIPKKCLITGGCGFLGSNIAAEYLGKGSEVTIIDALFRTGGEQNLAWLQGQSSEEQLHFHKFDLADAEAVDQVFRDHGPFDYICHLGGQVAMTVSLADPLRDLKTNVIGTFNVLESARRHSPLALVAYSSTNKVYGDLEELDYVESDTRYSLARFPRGLDESVRLDFASPYGCSKGAADQYVHDWYRNFGLKTVVFRHSSIYGGRQFSTFDQGWIGWFCAKACEQQGQRAAGSAPTPFTIAGSGKQVRDVLHAEDLIRLYDLAYQNQDKVAGNVYNIGGGIENSLSLLELFELLQHLTDQEALLFERLPVRKSDQRFFVADISKAGRDLGWIPRISSSQGISRMLEWVRTIQ